jgi:hypothetical protein
MYKDLHLGHICLQLLKKRLKAAADRQAELLAKREAKPQSEAELSQTSKVSVWKGVMA